MPTLRVLLGLISFAAVDAFLFSPWIVESDVAVVGIGLAAGVALGWFVGRWWVMGASVVWIPLALIVLSDSELSPLGAVVVVGVPAAAIQAAGIAVGVLVHRETATRYSPGG